MFKVFFVIDFVKGWWKQRRGRDSESIQEERDNLKLD